MAPPFRRPGKGPGKRRFAAFTQGLSGFFNLTGAWTTEVVSLIKAVSTSKNVAIAEQLTVIKQALISAGTKISQAENLQLVKQTLRAVTISIGETLTLIKTVGKSATASSAQTLALLKSDLKRLTISVSQTLSLVKTALKAITIGSAESLTLARSVLRSATISSVESVKLINTALKTLGFGTAQAITLARAVSRLTSALSGQSLSLTKAVGKAISVGGGQSVTLATTFVSGAGGAFSQLANIVSSQVVALTKAVSTRFSSLSSQSLQLLKTVSHAATSSPLGETVTLAKNVSKLVNIASQNFLTIVPDFRSGIIIVKMVWSLIKTVNKAVPLSGGLGVQVAKAISSKLAVVSGNLARLTAILGKTIVVSSAETASVVANLVSAGIVGTANALLDALRAAATGIVPVVAQLGGFPGGIIGGAIPRGPRERDTYVSGYGAGTLAVISGSSRGGVESPSTLRVATSHVPLNRSSARAASQLTEDERFLVMVLAEAA